MSPAVSILVTVVGVLLIAVALRDVFDTLFHPAGRQATSRAVMRAIWRMFKPVAKRRPNTMSLAGPIMVVVIVGLWALALVVGWALIYWPHVDSSLSFQPDARHGGLAGLVDVLYLSIVSVTTLGFGDITPSAAWLRAAIPLEAFLGFGLLTASISWLGSIYPAVQRRRALAYEIHLLREAQTETEIDLVTTDPDSAMAIYADLISRVVATERDLVSFPISYYFAQNDGRFSLSAAMPYVWRIATAGSEEGVDERVRLRAVMLRETVSDFAVTVAERFHRSADDDTETLLAAYARDHLREPDQSKQPS